MGWLSECGTHEGYLVGLVFDDAGVFMGNAGYPDPASGMRSGRMRELSARDEGPIPSLRFVKVACGCGWRSPLIRAPSGTEWHPCIVCTSDAFDEQCRKLWRAHLGSSPRALDGGCSVVELVGSLRR